MEKFFVFSIDTRTGAITSVVPRDFGGQQAALDWIEDEAPAGNWLIQKVSVKS